MVSKMRHEKGTGTYHEAPVMSTTVSEKGGGRWMRNIPNEGLCLLWLGIIRDDVSVSWDAMSETGNEIQEGKKDHTRVGDERLVNCLAYKGRNDLCEVRT